MNPTKTRKLGRTEIELTQFGFGAASLGETFALVSEEDAQATLQTLWDHGIRYFDTAPLYGWGLSEHRVGNFLYRKPRHEFVLSTKVGRILRAPAVKEGFKAPWFKGGLPYDHVFDYSYGGIMRSYEDSLQRLRLNRIDLLAVHDLEVLHHGEGLQAFRDQLANGGWRALEELRSTGEVRAIGAGINERGAIAWFLENFDPDFFILARNYTLLEQEALDEDLPLSRERDTGIILASVFNSGILVTDPSESAMYVYDKAPPEIIDKVRQLERVCHRHNVPLAAAAIQFPLAHPCVTTVIPGALHPRQVEEDLGYFQTEIPSALWADLKAEGLLRQDAPTP